MIELWKEIPGWSFYEVSNFGNVRSWKPHHLSKMARRSCPLPKKPMLIKRGYFVLALKEKTESSYRRQFLYIHRLVASLFVPGEKPGLVVAHLDGSRTNNHFQNLIWCSQKENVSHMVLHGTKTENENHGSTLICNKGVKAILKLRDIGLDVVDIADIFEISNALVCDYVAGRARFAVVGKRSRRKEIEEGAIKRGVE